MRCLAAAASDRKLNAHTCTCSHTVRTLGGRSSMKEASSCRVPRGIEEAACEGERQQLRQWQARRCGAWSAQTAPSHSGTDGRAKPSQTRHRSRAQRGGWSHGPPVHAKMCNRDKTPTQAQQGRRARRGGEVAMHLCAFVNVWQKRNARQGQIIHIGTQGGGWIYLQAVS
jgi:hypothetical protein